MMELPECIETKGKSKDTSPPSYFLLSGAAMIGNVFKNMSCLRVREAPLRILHSARRNKLRKVATVPITILDNFQGKKVAVNVRE